MQVADLILLVIKNHRTSIQIKINLFNENKK